MLAAANNVHNLTAIIDYNKLQGLGSTTKIVNLEPLKEKFQSFGWNTVEVDGHDIDSIISQRIYIK